MVFNLLLKRGKNYAIVIKSTKEVVERFRIKSTALHTLYKYNKIYLEELEIIDLE